MSYPQDRTIDLPPELWLRIFDEALLVPGALSVDYDEPFERHSAFWNTPMHAAASQAIIGSAAVKSNSFALQLMLVSKRWHDLAIQKLYRHLHVRSRRYLQQLTSRLTSTLHWQPTNAIVESETRTLGSLVRRLDLTMTDIVLPSLMPSPEERMGIISELYSLFELMPMLEIFQNTSKWTIKHIDYLAYTSITFELEEWERIASIIGPSLRRLELDPTRYVEDFSVGSVEREFLRIFPRLRTVTIENTIFREGCCWLCYTMSHPPPITMRSLGLIDPSMPLYDEPWCGVDHIGRATASAFPNLSCLFLDHLALDARPGNDNSSINGQFIRIYGSEIRTVYLLGWGTGWPVVGLGSTFQVLQDHCPRLSGLVLCSSSMFHADFRCTPSYRNEKRIGMIKQIPKTVTRLAVSVYFSQFMEHEKVVCWLAVPEIRDTFIKSIFVYDTRSRNIDIWTRPTMQTSISSAKMSHAMEDSVEQSLLDDSLEDLFSDDERSRIPHERFLGALKRLADWGIQVDFSDNLSSLSYKESIGPEEAGKAIIAPGN